LISSVVTHDWAHIVENCDLDNWKEALAVVLTYALPEEFSALCDTLATRLESEQNGALSLNASLCYVCSGNVEKLVENWIKNTEDATQPLALQDLVEKVMVLRKAVEVSRGTAPAVSGGALAEKLSQYAGLLAAQGSLSTALTYLNNSSDHTLALLQDRLRRAIDPTSARGVAAPFGIVNILPEGAPQPQQHAAATNSRPGMRSSAPAKTVTPGSYQSMSGGGSLQTTPTYAANYYSPGVSSKYPSYLQNPSIPTYDSSGYPSQNYTQPNYSQSQLHNNQPGIHSPPQYQPAPAPQPNMFNPMNPGVTPGPYVPPPPVPTTQPAMFSYQDKAAETAWNDPPIVQEKQKPIVNYTNSTPANIFTPQPVGNGDRGPPGAPAYQGLYNPMEHQLQAPPIQTSQSFGSFNQSTQGPQTNGPSASQASPAPEPLKQVEKGPIPTEHQLLQDMLDKLVRSCAQVAPNAQMKRKLEDVSRKLEILYDKLRGGMLSQAVLLGLHQIVQAIQQYDYGSGLNVYTGMVSHGNFSEISNFMPAIKVLLQSAMQMQVYVQ
ncbi:transport protein Sec31A, partial [Elysia marginata]